MSQGFRGKKNFHFVAYGSKVISIKILKIWTSGGARELELETPNLLWLMVTLSSISVPNFTTFPQAVLWAAIDFQSGRRRIIIIKKNIAASSNYGAKHSEAI